MSAEDRDYLAKHNVADIVETLLTHVVPLRAPRPHEVLSQSTVPALWTEEVSSCYTDTFADAETLKTLDFDVFKLDIEGPALVAAVVEMFSGLHLLERFQVTRSEVAQFVLCVRANYHNEVPFHNFRHAFNVCQTLYAYLHLGSARSHLQDVEIYAMLIAALCHDLQHPGVNNAHLSATLAPLALRYNDQAVLENHHAAMTFVLLQHNAAMTRSLMGDELPLSSSYLQFRQVIVRCILSTEVIRHKESIAKLEDVASDGFSHENDEHRQRYICALLEAADISNEARAFSFSQQWAPLVAEEFFRQGDQERKLGIPVKPMMDRATAVVAKEQVGFINFLCLPLYKALARILPEMQQCVSNLESNKKSWEESLTA